MVKQKQQDIDFQKKKFIVELLKFLMNNLIFLGFMNTFFFKAKK